MMMKKAISSANFISFSRFTFKGVVGRFLTSQAASALQSAVESPAYSASSDEESADMDLDNLGFSLVQTDFMYTMKSSQDMNFVEGQIRRYGNIELNPAAGVLNYGQGIFEGMKAYRTKDGRIVLFRPQKNAMRMKIGAERMCMPCPSLEQFVDAVKQTALANKRWIPPPGKGSLYMRPLLLGTAPILGLAPSPEYTFLVYASPVGSYFKEGTAPLSLFVENEFDRASRGGTGGIKTISNYGPAIKALMRAKSRGYSDVLYLDSVHHEYVEEASASNIFLVKDGIISTPVTDGTILPGITRKIVVAPVGTITYNGKRAEYYTGEDSACNKVGSTLLGIQNGVIEDNKGWVMEI
ncbi:hypothetical protein V2J09_023882 [Rumex salicifolius]